VHAFVDLLPTPWRGVMLAGFAAAYMSTISTHLNWGASYVVQDFYRRFLRPDHDERHYVAVARVTTVGLILLAMLVGLWLENAVDAFNILLQIGAGTGLVFLLRWFWWRVNAWSEITGMLVSFLLAVHFTFVHERIGLAPLDASLQLVLGVLGTTVAWVAVTWLTPPADRDTLQRFYDRIRPRGRGWRRVVDTRGRPPEGSLGAAFACWGLGCVVVYAAMFGTGWALYGRGASAVAAVGVAAVAGFALLRLVPKVGFE
jgi:Na+/proline symporter